MVRDYCDFTIDWYKVCWPWMAVYSSVLPCLVLLMLPFGSMMVLGGTIPLDRMVLVFCMSFAVGPSVLKALTFAGKFPTLDYKIAELEKMMEHPPLKEGTSGFTGESLDVAFEDVHFSYEDTVYNNIAIGRSDATREEVEEAAKKARCILKDAPIVILDEATASVDADNERAIQEAISELCRDKTLIVIAHRLKTIKDADQILVVSGGQIIERGDHGSLMEQGGTYAHMVSLQAS